MLIFILFTRVDLGCEASFAAPPFFYVGAFRFSSAMTQFNRAFEEESNAYKLHFGHDEDFYGDCRYRPDESSKYLHAGSPLDGAWRVEMLPESMKRNNCFDKDVMKRFLPF
jgi:hypothetical protein